MNKNILDVPRIKKTIKEKHGEFLAAVGQIPTKISADRQLTLARVSARISQILHIFKEEGIIDIFDDCCLPEADSSCKGFHISKRGFEKTIYIWTDGNDIVMKDSSFMISSGVMVPFKKIIRDIDFEEYNWESFVEQLLDYIHVVIYERFLSYEKVLWRDV